MRGSYPFQSAKAKREYTKYYYEIEKQYWPVPFSDVYVKTSYGPTFVRVSGPAGAPPLLLLPGVSTTSITWAPNARDWAKHFRLYTPDMINDHGLSVDEKHLFTRQDLLRWMDDLMNQLHLPSVNLLGYSYGGWLAAEYALHAPERVEKLVMISPGATVMHMSTAFLVRSSLVALKPIAASRALFKWLFQDAMNNSEQCGMTFNKFMEISEMRFRSFKRRFLVPLRVLSADQWKQITMPALFMVGEHEKLYDPGRAMDEIARKAPQVERRLILGAGHDITAVQSVEVNRVVEEFLRRERK